MEIIHGFMKESIQMHKHSVTVMYDHDDTV